MVGGKKKEKDTRPGVSHEEQEEDEEQHQRKKKEQPSELGKLNEPARILVGLFWSLIDCTFKLFLWTNFLHEW